MKFELFGSILLDTEKVTALEKTGAGGDVRIYFDNGKDILIQGETAEAVWDSFAPSESPGEFVSGGTNPNAFPST